ncbi:hypothetical protein HGRIS_004825 [Hohenbuehelia grisea]|uniref:RING-type E3 ubiquitin transferase n=1 Tax=Hohenbuehelia grisea TaxID=104357 RepID=A0ABR3JDZ4_9AGAR
MPDTCMFYVVNRCKHGEKCLYLHELPAGLRKELAEGPAGHPTNKKGGESKHPSQVKCSFYSQGTCKNGASCKFSHSDAGAGSKLPCKFFAAGKCKNGDSCPFSHLPRTAQSSRAGSENRSKDNQSFWSSSTRDSQVWASAGNEADNDNTSSHVHPKSPSQDGKKPANGRCSPYQGINDEPKQSISQDSSAASACTPACSPSTNASSSDPPVPGITLTEASSLASDASHDSTLEGTQNLSPLGTPFCRFSIEATCANGDNCSSSHSSTGSIIYPGTSGDEVHASPDKPGSKDAPCKFYAQGNCKRGNQCWFRHNGTELFEESRTYASAPPPSSTKTPPSQDRSFKRPWTGGPTKPCRYFALGKCWQADQCTFLHEEHETSLEPDPQTYEYENSTHEETGWGTSTVDQDPVDPNATWGESNDPTAFWGDSDQQKNEEQQIPAQWGDSDVATEEDVVGNMHDSETSQAVDDETSAHRTDKGKSREVDSDHEGGFSTAQEILNGEDIPNGDGWGVDDKIGWGSSWGTGDTSGAKADESTERESVTDYGTWGKASQLPVEDAPAELKWGVDDESTPWDTAPAASASANPDVESWGRPPVSKPVRWSSSQTTDNRYDFPSGACRYFIQNGHCKYRGTCQYSHIPGDRKRFMSQTQAPRAHRYSSQRSESYRDSVPHLRPRHPPQQKYQPAWLKVLPPDDPNAAKQTSRYSVTDNLPGTLQDERPPAFGARSDAMPFGAPVAGSRAPTGRAAEATGTEPNPAESPSDDEAFPYLDLPLPTPPAPLGASHSPLIDSEPDAGVAEPASNAKEEETLSDETMRDPSSGSSSTSEESETSLSAEPQVKDVPFVNSVEPNDIGEAEVQPALPEAGEIPVVDGNDSFPNDEAEIHDSASGPESPTMQPVMEEEPFEPPLMFEMDARPDSTHRSMFGCAVRFGAGAVPEQIVTAFESRRLILSNLSFHISADDVHELAMEYGHITGVMVNPPVADNISALIQFAACEDAARAFDGLNGKQYRGMLLSAHLDLRGVVAHTNGDSRSRFVKLSWPAPSRHGWAYYDEITKAKAEAARLNGALCEGRKVEMSFERPKKSQKHSFAVKISGLPLGLDKARLKNFCVGSATVHVGERTFPEVTGDVIRKLLGRYGKVDIMSILPTDRGQTRVVAVAKFDTPDNALNAARGVNGTEPAFLGGQILRCQHTHHVKYSVADRRRLTVIKPALDRLRDAGMDTRLSYHEDGDVTRIWLFGTDAMLFIKTKIHLETILYGEVLMYRGQRLWHSYFDTHRCELLFAKLNKDPSIFIYRNILTQAIHLIGNDDAKIPIKKQIMQQSSKLHSLTQKLPVSRALLRNLIEQSMSAIEDHIGTEKATLGVAEAIVEVCGPPSDLMAVRSILALAEAKLPPLPVVDSFSAGMLCPGCSRKAKTPIQLPCGHTYCRACLRHILTNAFSPRYPSIRCLKELAADDDGNNAHYCNEEAPYAAIAELLSPAEEKVLLEASFLSHVREALSDYEFCPTPSCRVVFRTGGPDTILECPDCKICICPSCRTTYHDGLSCAEFQALICPNAF